MDDFLRLAYERRERLRRELSAVEHLIAEHERLESATHKSTQQNYELALDLSKRSRAGSRVKGSTDGLFDAAERVILREGRPLSRSELMDRLQDEGFTFPGTDKVKVFGTNLWRSRRFVSLKGIGYWPEAHKLPAQYQSAEHRESMLRHSS
jgi:hypothetical protein